MNKTTVISLIGSGAVMVVATSGRRSAAAVAALSAAVSFDYFHTVPYHSLTIANRNDLSQRRHVRGGTLHDGKERRGDECHLGTGIDEQIMILVFGQQRVEQHWNDAGPDRAPEQDRLRVARSIDQPRNGTARRNNAEVGNHAFKAILGDQIYSKDPLAQKVEILCMALAYNLTRLVFLEVEQGIKVSFAAGAQIMRSTPWQHRNNRSTVALRSLYRVEFDAS